MVVLHDELVDRTTDGSGPVRALSHTALARLDAGYRFRAPDGTFPYRDRGIRVPTLAELLEAHPDAPLNIEIKQQTPAIEHAVLETLDRHGARGRTLLAAEDADIMARIRAAAPDVVTSFSAAEVADFVFRLRRDDFACWTPRGVALQVPPAYLDTAIITPESVAVAHRFGVEVHAWTINDAAEMERLLDLGVDGIMTDLPAVGARVVARRRGG